MTAAIWSTPPGKCNARLSRQGYHYLLQLTRKTLGPIDTILGGSHTLAQKSLRRFHQLEHSVLPRMSYYIASVGVGVVCGPDSPTARGSIRRCRYGRALRTPPNNSSNTATEARGEILGEFRWEHSDTLRCDAQHGWLPVRAPQCWDT